mgnify:FL=1
MNTTKVTRFEVIDETGRAFVMYGAKDLTLQLQDDDRTLKVFVSSKAPARSRGDSFSIDKAIALPDAALAQAYAMVFGEDWKKGWSDQCKARLMRNILKGDDQPCIPFPTWVRVVGFIDDCTK